MKITPMNFPEKSHLFPGYKNYDYSDSFGCVIDDANNVIGIDDVTEAFASLPPRWAVMLLKIRDGIASLAGLKTGEESYEGKRSDQCVPGDKLGFYNVYDRTPNEIILGENDKHLNFRISLFLDTHESNPLKKTIAVTTVVVINNWMGHIYFFFVKPLHRCIVPVLLEKDFSRFG